MFLKDGVLDGPGYRIGICGTKKDHRRVYYCGKCMEDRSKVQYMTEELKEK